MDLPVMPPLQPMLAKAASSVPAQPESGLAWSYEPKWDGFRTLVFRDGDEVVLGSRGGKDLARYFPELVRAVKDELPERCVVDGELVVPRSIDGRTRLDWESLSERIHPAESRVAMLSEKTPAQFVAFDLLALGDRDLSREDFSVRRAQLVDTIGGGPSCHVTAATESSATAIEWFEAFEGAGLDGVVAKKLVGPYLPNKREMVKVKHARTADCVVIGYRPHKSQPGIGSMLLGLYDGDQMAMVGGASAFTAARRIELLAELDELRVGDDVVADGAPTRWQSGNDRTWVPLRPERVVEVAYDQMEGARFRHAARFLRWRPDRTPDECTFQQLEVPVRYDLADVLAGGS
ncbi:MULTISPECIES: ATP-dependent DNA ligase [Rhodococcus]|uniref:ATP-dependent DNA ligase n=1 Tax=Rhodococcus TaxID=1827 RepID=UPI0002A25176|nr:MULTISPECIES: ATP-dependent DNA ligase [Rhodococcus]ELB94144.1 ATP-dependent DNA ligase [Rhodococcus wratislaviensis IFP 2016]MDI9935010.1 ATP-dependent DNA ligase [Rhodococcus sp. IEGM 1351]MDJ0414052.1 ATP-dependent DNA ligase [Rhodococcus opacus]MDV6241551.1 ATP-dependent DNA ligase [Rhodococcus opacus]MDX5969612.1 ATP-dependent DNA ligase [Rhodococcus opacus]